eukprot:sb/3464217/
MSTGNLKENDIILGELLNLAVNNTNALKVFNAYDLDGSFESNLDTLRKLPEKALVAACNLLGLNPLVDGKKRYGSRTTLAEWVIMNISVLFVYDCGSCGEEYQVERLSKPKVRCRVCGQGSHDCDPFLEAYKALEKLDVDVPGLSWLCHPCARKNFEAFPGYTYGESDEKVATDGESSDSEFQDKISPVQEKKGKRGRKKKNPSEDDVITPVTGGDNQPNRRDLKLQLDSKDSVPKDDSQVEKTSEEKDVKKSGKSSSKFENVCEAYKKKACPHGRKGDQLVNGVACSKNHPVACNRYISHGATSRSRGGCPKGKDCQYFHPPICRNSEIKRQCLDPDCDWIHHKHTRRTLTPAVVTDVEKGNAGTTSKGKTQKKADPKVKPNKNGNNTKTGLVDQDFLLTTMGTLRDGMMEEMLGVMKKLLREEMAEIRAVLSPPGELERFRHRSSPALTAKGTPAGSTPMSRNVSYGDIIKRSQNLFCSTPEV